MNVAVNSNLSKWILKILLYIVVLFFTLVVIGIGGLVLDVLLSRAGFFG